MNSELRIASSVFSVGSLLYVSGICSMQLGQVLVSPGVGENKQTKKKENQLATRNYIYSNTWLTLSGFGSSTVMWSQQAAIYRAGG